MGVVYRARDSTIGRVVALKMLSPELGAEDELHQRFMREAQAIGRLNHPSIVTVYDMGGSAGQLYMAMELLEGDDLRNLIQQRADLPIADRVLVMLQIADGVGYASGRGVVHRDLKPANIFVTVPGKVKLLDFGLAQVADRATITRRGVILGTPDYMSPEQASGRNLDHRTDIFSAGAVFYEFLTFQKPFQGKTLHAVLYQILSEPPESLLTLNPELPARLAAIVHKMLEKDVERRYQSMEDVARDLRPIYEALRRSRGRSAAVWGRPSVAGEDARAKAREHLGRGRVHHDAGRFAQAVSELNEALALDPFSDDVCELLWRALRQQQQGRPAAVQAAVPARLEALLAQAAPGQPEAEARRALEELALIAPDDPRVRDRVRERAQTQPKR
jgi:tetratricopeptide (TPR) repeat protein